ncbi:MAG: hypothetical protein AMXMBFR34_29490 [Myxococcaceae bacterium]
MNGVACTTCNTTLNDTCDASGQCRCGAVTCDTRYADRCTAGACRCGAGNPCTSGQRCAGGTCVCNATSCPVGCCNASNQCRPGTALTECGYAGTACQSCPGCAPPDIRVCSPDPEGGVCDCI